ncbi:MAG: hypothetical protein JWM11_3982 [Planctomycetaceae bacterium]|nr:hypothetical protein [Planctomycetaceae bacterium]
MIATIVTSACSVAVVSFCNHMGLDVGFNLCVQQMLFSGMLFGQILVSVNAPPEKNIVVEMSEGPTHSLKIRLNRIIGQMAAWTVAKVPLFIAAAVLTHSSKSLTQLWCLYLLLAASEWVFLSVAVIQRIVFQRIVFGSEGSTYVSITLFVILLSGPSFWSKVEQDVYLSLFIVVCITVFVASLVFLKCTAIYWGRKAKDQV